MGTFYFTRGWIEHGDNPQSEYERLKERYGEKKAMTIQKLFIKNYKRLALINTGNYPVEKYRNHVRKQAELFNLAYHEIPGENRLLKNLVSGDWDGEFVVVAPGETIRYEMFMPGAGLD